MVVGVTLGNSGGVSDTGRLWVLRLFPNGTVSHVQTIANGEGGMASGTLTGNNFFGRSSTECGDIDRDGFNDIIASAFRANAGGSDNGALFVLFMQANDAARDIVRISEATGEGFDRSPVTSNGMGWSIALIPPRLPGNPVDVAVTAEDNQLIILFRLASNGTVIGIPEAINNGREGLPSGAIQGSSGFGEGADALGDLDGDGVYEIAVTASLDDEAGTNSGALYIFFFNPGIVADALKSFLKILPTIGGLDGVAPTGDRMIAIAAVGDLDGDGRTEIVLGFEDDAVDFIVVARLGGLLPSVSPTPSVTPSVSSTPSATPSVSPTPSVTPSPAAVGTVYDAVKVGNNQGGLPSGVIAAGDRFGDQIAPMGDLDGDGVPDIAIGAGFDDDGFTDAGAVYIVFMNSDRTAKGYQKISHTTSSGVTLGSTHIFGSYMARLDQPMGDDGHLPRLVVGEPHSDVGVTDVGRIWVLRLNVTGEVLHAQAIANGVGGLPSGTLVSLDYFGASVTTNCGDIDDDGLNDVLVSATGTDAGGSDLGALYVLFMQAGDTIRTFTMISQAAGEGLDGLPGPLLPFLGDGLAAIPPRSNGNPVDVAISTGSSSVVLFRLASNGTVVGTPELIADGTEGVTSGTFTPSSAFGNSMYALGDLDGDGQDDLSLGDESDDDAGTNSGAVYILFLNPGSEADAVKSLLKITPATSGLSGVAASGQQMLTLSMIGDLDGDGRSEAAFGFVGTGADFIVVARLGGLLPSASPTPSASASSSPTPSVTPSSTPSLSPSPSNAAIGTVYSATKIGSGLGGFPAGLLTSNDRFGESMSGIGDIDGDGVVDLAVQAFEDDDGASDAGALYILFMHPNSTVKGYQKISATEGRSGFTAADGTQFGWYPSRLD